MITLKVKSNSAAFAKSFEASVERQIPFITSVALNNTLTKTRDNEVWRDYQTKVTARNKPFFRQFMHVYRSNKSQARAYGAVIGSIQEKMAPPPPGVRAAGGRVADTSFMRNQVRGGVKVPRGQKIAVPLSGSGVGRKAGGAIRKAHTPRSITAKKNGFRAGNYIMKRQGKKTKVMYKLIPSAKIRPVLDPLSSVRRGLNSRFRHEFNRAYITAIKTTRVR